MRISDWSSDVCSSDLGTQGYLGARFSVYCVTKGADDLDRRRGTGRVIGAYDLVCQLAPVLNGLDVPDVGTLNLLGIDNLFRDAMFDLGGTVYSLQFELPNMDFTYQADLSGAEFVDFTTWHAEHYNIRSEEHTSELQSLMRT